MNGPYDYYLLVPRSQKKASELTESAFKAWGIAISEKPSKFMDGCNDDDHKGHEYMLPFYKTNAELMEYYTRTMSSSDIIKQDAVRDDFMKLKEVEKAESYDKHFETKFHCLGDAFKYKQYRETDWAARLFYSIKDKLPRNTTAHPSYKYHNHFGALQQLFSCNSSAMKFYYFRSIPDLVITKTRETASDGEAGALYVVDNEEDLIEIKNGGRFVYTKTSDIPNAYAQLVGGLHFLAMTKIIRSVTTNKKLPKDISCKGLLINKKTSMTT